MNSTSTSPFIPTDLLLNEMSARQRGAKFHDLTLSQGMAFPTGFHLYVDFNVNLVLSAAESDKAAKRYLEMLAQFALIGEAAAASAKAQLLEDQGARLHFLIEDPSRAAAPSAESWHRLITLARAVINLTYERVAPLAGTAWQGCRAAADYSPAALLHSNVGGSSIVSLGVAANRPAKRLGQSPGVGAGCLAVPQAITPKELPGSNVRSWVEINLREPSVTTNEFMRTDLSDPLRQYLRNRQITEMQFGRVDRHYFEALHGGGAVQPVQVQGFCLRCDLDGFTKQVAAAFEMGPEAVQALVNRFRALLQFPQEFARSLQAQTILLPWAGDCATVLILPSYGESFTQMRSFTPVTAALTWHKAFGADKRYGEAIGEARWSLGMAAGDTDEGSDGRMIFADLPAAGRQFRVVAGWPAQRSMDAQQADGVIGGDTVITQVDRKHLWEHHAEAFKDHGTLFARATIAELSKQAAERERKARLSQSTPALSVPAILPSTRPYYGKSTWSH